MTAKGGALPAASSSARAAAPASQPAAPPSSRPSSSCDGTGRSAACSRRRACYFADTPSPCRLKHLLQGEGEQQNDSLADGYTAAGVYFTRA